MITRKNRIAFHFSMLYLDGETEIRYIMYVKVSKPEQNSLK